MASGQKKLHVYIAKSDDIHGTFNGKESNLDHTLKKSMYDI